MMLKAPGVLPVFLCAVSGIRASRSSVWAGPMRGYQQALRSGIWGEAYPSPPHRYPTGIETPRTLPNLTARLLERGYGDTDVGKTLGGNWLRVMRTVWGP